jgi:putative protease
VKDTESALELEVDGKYIMSPKDLNTLSFLDKILDAGVRVLKLEGRGRSPEYVKIVSKTYREAVNAWFEGKYTQENINRWNTELSRVYNRGFWDGYYLGRKTGEWTEEYGNQATDRKMYIGKITNYYSKIGVAELKVEAHFLEPGEKIMVIGSTTGVYEDTLTEIHLERKPVKSVRKGDICSLPVTSLLRRGDKLYKVVKADRSVPNLVQK